MKAYDIVNDFIINSIEQGGILPWQRSWKCEGNDFNAYYNFVTKKPYSGINTIVLSIASLNFSKPYFLTYNQVKKLGGNIVKGSKGFPVIYFNIVEKEDKETGNKRKIPFAKYSTVFNVEQCTGLDLSSIETKEIKETKEEFVKLKKCEEIVENYKGPSIEHGGNKACYNFGLDLVKMPEQRLFNSSEEYYSTLFHELGHSTGHKDRLNREFGSSFGDHKYSKEELVAEFTSCYLCTVSGIDKHVISNSVSYINSWLEVLKSDKRLLVQASKKAQESANLILGV